MTAMSEWSHRKETAMRATVLNKPGTHERRSATRLVAAILTLASCAGAGPSRSADAESSSPATADAGSSHPVEPPMKLRLIMGDTVLTATLEASSATHDFVSLLPLNLTLRDHAGTEKVSDLPRRLSTSGAPPGATPQVGDIGYYAPWGNLALYYRDFEYSSGLVKLGHIESGVEALEGARGDLAVRFELADEGS